MQSLAVEAAEGEVPLVECALRLRIPWHAAYRLALCGRLVATRRGGRWYVTVASLDQLAAELLPRASGERARQSKPAKARRV